MPPAAAPMRTLARRGMGPCRLREEAEESERRVEGPEASRPRHRDLRSLSRSAGVQYPPSDQGAPGARIPIPTSESTDLELTRARRWTPRRSVVRGQSADC
jgi:hypothetical protein